MKQEQDYSVKELMAMPLEDLVRLDFTKLSEKGKLVVIKRDPVMWAKSFIQIYNIDLDKYAPWTPRWYQAEMLRDRSLRKVFRCGRRCVTGNLKIQDPETGLFKTVKQLFDEDKEFNILALDDNYQIEIAPNAKVYDNGIKPVYRITTNTGRTFDATDNHPFLTELGWLELKDLTVGDNIAIPMHLNYFGSDSIEESELRLMAQKLNKDMSSDKSIPKEVFSLNKESVSIFVSELIKDAYKEEDEVPINRLYCSESGQLAYQLAHLLMRFGIVVKIVKERNSYFLGFVDKKKYNRIKNHSHKNMFSVYYSYKFQPMTDKLNKMFLSYLKYHELRKTNFEYLKTGRLTLEEYLESKTINKAEAKELAEHLGFESIEDILNGDIFWDPVVSIEYLGEQQTYDVSVPRYRNFIANDIISHNTGKTETMVVEALYNVFTRKNFIHMFVTPYQSQIRMIFDNIRQKIDSSALIKKEVTRATTNPYLFEFSNGSKIVGFTTGANSGMSAASIRGWRADWISLDEMDYLGEGDFDTVYALCMERDTIGLTCSSTPTGKRSKFFEICTNKSLGLK